MASVSESLGQGQAISAIEFQSKERLSESAYVIRALERSGDLNRSLEFLPTEEEIAENAADGIRISEFPVSMEAAMAAKRAGMQVIAGAPNIVRGGSHSGNVAADTEALTANSGP